MKLQWTFYSTYAIYNCRIFGIENQKRTRFCNEFRFCSGLRFGNFLEANACRIDQFLSSCCRKGEEIRSMVSSFSVCVEKKRGREREYCRFFYPVEEMRPWRASLSRRYSKKFRPWQGCYYPRESGLVKQHPSVFFIFMSLGRDQNVPIGLIPFVGSKLFLWLWFYLLESDRPRNKSHIKGHTHINIQQRWRTVLLCSAIVSTSTKKKLFTSRFFPLSVWITYYIYI